MDAKQIAERHVVERYLANQLSDAEAEAFEAYVESHPEVTRQIEIAARMKSGLRVLQRRGELQGVLNASPRSWMRHPALLVSAAASIALVSFLVFRFAGSEANVPLMANSLEELEAINHSEFRIASSLSMTSVRGGPHGDVLNLPLDDNERLVVDILLVLGVEAPADGYSIELLRLADGQLESVARLHDVAAPTGTLRVFVRAKTLTDGNYVIRVTEAGSAAPIEYTLQVARPSS